MEQLTNNNLSKNASSIQQTHKTNVKKKRKIGLFCNECNKKRYRLDESHQICHICYRTKTLFKPSGNKVIDDFIRYTLINHTKLRGKMEFVPYDQFKNIEFIAEGGFSKIYNAIWIDGPTKYSNSIQSFCRHSQNYNVVLKKLNNSRNVTSKELNELKTFYEFSLKSKVHKYVSCISEYFGITQDPITQDIMIIMEYYKSGDLMNYFITNDFYNISWSNKLESLRNITRGLKSIHEVNIVHRDLHSGNIFFNKHFDYEKVVIGDLGISKSATELSTDDNNNENYGIIPYMAPEIFQGQKYTTASDIYSFGMIMWEFMTGRRPFWNKIHNAELIIEICDGLRPPIVTDAPEGYIDLMKECWHPDPKKRPSASNLYSRISNIQYNEPSSYSNNSTKIIKSPDIGPVTMNNPGAIYKSRPLSGMIQSAMSTRSLRSQSINLETDLFHHYQKSHISFYDKRKFDNNQIESSFNGMITLVQNKRMKLIESENNDYITKEIELDVDVQNDHVIEYKTQEIDFDIDTF